MLEQLRNMLHVITKEQTPPSGQFLDADICVLMRVQPIVTEQLVKTVQFYVRSVLDARMQMNPTKEIHQQFMNTMETFGGLDGAEPRSNYPYLITARGAPQDWMIKGSKRTLLQMTVEKFVYARAEAAMESCGRDFMDEIFIQSFQYNFRNEMTKLALRYDYATMPKDPEMPVQIVVEVALPGNFVAHRFVLAINLHGEILLDVNRDGYDAAFTINQGWLPAY